MTKEEIGYLQGVSKPKITIEYREIKGEFIEKSYIPVHGIELITIEKKDIDFIKKTALSKDGVVFFMQISTKQQKKDGILQQLVYISDSSYQDKI